MTVSIINTLKISQECNSASSTIEEKNFEIESLCYKALEIVEKKNLVVGISTRADTIDDLLKSGIASDLIQANEVLRWLEDDHEMFLEDSGLLKVITHRNISSFDRHQRQLQEQWLGVREFGSSCEINEEREIRAVAIVREEEEQKQQQKNKKRGYHRHHVYTRKQTEEDEQQREEVCFLK